jgi:hypothetical protein
MNLSIALEITHFTKGQTGELWKQLCAQAAIEQDSEKLLELTKEINRLLAEKEERLKGTKPTLPQS